MSQATWEWRSRCYCVHGGNKAFDLGCWSLTHESRNPEPQAVSHRPLCLQSMTTYSTYYADAIVTQRAPHPPPVAVSLADGRGTRSSSYQACCEHDRRHFWREPMARVRAARQTLRERCVPLLVCNAHCFVEKGALYHLARRELEFP